jgi:hypothetical protein
MSVLECAIESCKEMLAPGGDDDFLIKNHRFLIETAR